MLLKGFSTAKFAESKIDFIIGQNIMRWSMPRRPHHHLAAYTDATPRPRREHRRTICRTSRSVRSPDNRTARRWATLLDTGAPGRCSPLPLLPSTPRAVAHQYAPVPRIQLDTKYRIRL